MIDYFYKNCYNIYEYIEEDEIKMPRRKDIPKGMPNYSDLINPTLVALQELGGSGTINEIYSEVLKNMQLSEKIIDFQHSDKSSQTEIQYRLAWARTYLKIYGIIEKTQRGVWAILPEHKDKQSVDIDDCINTVRSLSVKKKDSNFDPKKDENLEDDGVELPDENRPWRERLLHILLSMNPFSFERLTQRMLRESGFYEVEVTKKTGDGGIDGYGRVKINGMISFKVAFQCKRYSGSVPSSDIRDFRGSLTTDIEKALFITTGTFSKPARDEAMTSGKIQIDLIDGEDFIDRLAKYNIGLTPVTEYEIDEKYFMQL